MARFLVSVSELQAKVDPLSGEMWKCAPISVAEVRDAMATDRTIDMPWAVAGYEVPPELQREYHICRIARLAQAPIINDEHPMLGAIAPDRVWIYDGNHRIAAAIVRGDAALEVGLAPFEPEAVLRTFPSARPV